MTSLDRYVGQILDDKYRLERLLGQGGMGAVYLATHLGTDRYVALKLIAPQFMRNREFVERFKREARAAGRLRHPNVVDVTDFGFARSGCSSARASPREPNSKCGAISLAVTRAASGCARRLSLIGKLSFMTSVYEISLLNQFGCKGKPNSPASPMAAPNAAKTSEVQSSQRLRVKAVTASMASETESAASDKSN